MPYHNYSDMEVFFLFESILGTLFQKFPKCSLTFKKIIIVCEIRINKTGERERQQI